MIRMVTGFNMYAQETYAWCWAAASQMIQQRFLANGITQCQIVSNYVGQGVNCCATPRPQACYVWGPLQLPHLRRLL